MTVAIHRDTGAEVDITDEGIKSDFQVLHPECFSTCSLSKGTRSHRVQDFFKGKLTAIMRPLAGDSKHQKEIVDAAVVEHKNELKNGSERLVPEDHQALMTPTKEKQQESMKRAREQLLSRLEESRKKLRVIINAEALAN